MTYPQYRCYSDKRSFFRIDSPTQLQEIKVLGAYYQLFDLNAVQLPDRNFISDLLNRTFDGVEVLSEQEFESEKSVITESKKLLE